MKTLPLYFLSVEIWPPAFTPSESITDVVWHSTAFSTVWSIIRNLIFLTLLRTEIS